MKIENLFSVDSKPYTCHITYGEFRKFVLKNRSLSTGEVCVDMGILYPRELFTIPWVCRAVGVLGHRPSFVSLASLEPCVAVDFREDSNNDFDGVSQVP